LGDVSVGSSSNLRKSRYERIQKRKKENKKHGAVGLDSSSSSSSSSHLGIHERNFLTEGFSQANDDNQPIQGLVIRFYKFSHYSFFFFFFFFKYKIPYNIVRTLQCIFRNFSISLFCF
jgi:tRNA splicing ligase